MRFDNLPRKKQAYDVEKPNNTLYPCMYNGNKLQNVEKTVNTLALNHVKKGVTLHTKWHR